MRRGDPTASVTAAELAGWLKRRAERLAEHLARSVVTSIGVTAMRLSKSFFASTYRRRASRRSTSYLPGQQFEPRCLLSAVSALDMADSDLSSVIDFETSFGSEFADLNDPFDFPDDFFSYDGFFGYFDDETDFIEFVDVIDGSSLPESFTLAPDSIQIAIENLSSSQGLDGSLFDPADFDAGSLQILSLTVTESSGVELPVDIFVWDGGADSVLTTGFLAQVESVLNETLKDVLATGTASSATDVELTSDGTTSAAASNGFASTYGIQPLEVYVDVSQDSLFADGDLYISGVTVVSEDPLDPEFLIFDEFYFFAEDFVQDTGVVNDSTQAPVLLEIVEPGSETVASSVTLDGEPESSGTGVIQAKEDAAVSESSADDRSDSSQADSNSLTPVAEDSNGRRHLTEVRLDQSRKENHSGHPHSRDGDRATGQRRAAHAERFRQRMSDAAQRDASTPAASRWRRLRVQAVATARQLAESVTGSESQLLAAACAPAAVGVSSLSWASRLSVFAQPSLQEQLLALTGSESADGIDKSEHPSPTYAQIASATGALAITLAAGSHAVRRQAGKDRKRVLRLEHAERTKDILDTETE